MIRKSLIILSITLFFFESFSQKKELLFENFSINKGLSHNTVHDIVQDEKGFLWIGTEDGLNRFDGYNFKKIKKTLSDSSSISGNFINCIFKDSKSNLWVGTNNGGINKYNHLTGTFKSIKSFQYQSVIYDFKNIKAITEDNEGNIWLGTSTGVFKLNVETFQITDFYNTNDSKVKLSDKYIRCMFMDNNILWIGTNKGGLNKLNITDQTIKYYKYRQTNDKSISDNSISYIYRDNSGDLWIGTSLGLNHFNEKTENFRRFYHDSKNEYSISDNDIFKILEDSKNNLWICTLNGLNLYIKQENKFYNWKNDPSQHFPIVDNHIFTIYEDKYNQIWLGSASKGLIKFNNQNKNFKHIKKTLNKPNSLPSNVVREIFEDMNQFLWIGYVQGGADVYNQKTGLFKHYEYDKNNHHSISSNQIITIFEDSKNDKWIGTWGGGLNKVLGHRGNYEFETFKHNPKDSFSLSDNVIKEITEDFYGNLWIGTATGINIFNTQDYKSIHINAIANKPNSLVNNSIQSDCIIFENPDIAWVGTWGGLSKILLSTETGLPEKFTNYVQNDSLRFSINEDRIISMYLDNKRNLWLGTFGGGLNKIILDDQSEIKAIKHYTENEGLANNVIYGILEDNSENLWLSTNNGISKFNPVSEQFTNYNEKDGLQSNQFYWGAACKLKSGQLAFGGINGLNLFFPDSINSDNTPAELVITQITVLNRTINYSKNSEINKNTPYADTLRLSYKDYVFSIEFSGLQFVDPQKNEYAYKLEGFDNDWIYTNAQKRYAVYTNLDPGEYIFKVKASNSDFIWNENSTNLVILIQPPFWKTIWFKALFVLFLILVLYGLYQLKVSTLKKQKNNLEQTVKSKTEKIINQNSELSALNEELQTSNDELSEQKEELGTTLLKLKNTQNYLVQSEKMASLGILAAGVAHEINNPLNFIKGGASALESYMNENLHEHIDQMKPMLGWVETGVERATVIITGLNHYSRSNSSKLEKCNIHEIIENCLIMLQNETKNRIDFNKNYTKEVFDFYCNEGKIHQAFLNILTNASHSIKEKGTIEISTGMVNNKINIIFIDTGTGIKQENINKIFDPFFTTKATGKGTGLGLSISQNIIKEYNGTISIKSEVGKGTTVEVIFPLV